MTGQEAVMEVKPQLLNPGEEWPGDLDRGRGPDEATVGPRWP